MIQLYYHYRNHIQTCTLGVNLQSKGLNDLVIAMFQNLSTHRVLLFSMPSSLAVLGVADVTIVIGYDVGKINILFAEPLLLM